jgi:hypothetical protein
MPAQHDVAIAWQMACDLASVEQRGGRRRFFAAARRQNPSLKRSTSAAGVVEAMRTADRF